MNRQISIIWKYYNLSINHRNIAICTICKSEISRGNPDDPSQFSTSPLFKHLQTKHPTEFEQVEKEKEQQVKEKSKTDLKTPKFKQESIIDICKNNTKWKIDTPEAIRVHKAIGLMIARDLQPYSIVEDAGFLNLIKTLEPRYEIPCRRYFRERVIPDIYEQVKTKIQRKISKAISISFTTDLWTSQHAIQSYLAFTAHWLDESFQRYSAVLNCKYMEGKHTAENIEAELKQIIDEWKIPVGKIHAIVRDNGRNIEKALRDAEFPAIPCFAHTLQLVVNDALTIQKEITEAISISKKIVGHFSHSSSKTDRY